MSAAERDPRQAQIHVARKQLGLDDDTYRDVLERVTGRRTSKGLDGRQMAAVIDEFKRLGWAAARPKVRSVEPRADLRLIYVLWRLLVEAGHVGAGRQALNAFIAAPNFQRKWGEVPTDLRFLTQPRAADVIEALKDMCSRHGVDLDLPR